MRRNLHAGLRVMAAAVVAACVSAARGELAAAPAALPDDFCRGVNHAHVHRGDRGYGSDVSAAELATLKRLGVNWVALTPFGYQAAATADQVFSAAPDGPRRGREDPSLTEAGLEREIANARALGIKVVLKPHIWSRDFWDGAEWQGTIRQDTPEAHARWWAGFRAMALHYGRLAQRSGAEAYCIGTELSNMTRQHPQEWRDLIAEIRSLYRGHLIYCAHHDAELEEVAFWDALDCIGVSGYFPLEAPEAASVEQLAAAWEPHRRRLSALSARAGKPIVFMEVGYRPVADTHRTPWTYSGGVEDMDAQARAFEAMFRALADEPWWRGAFVWKTFTDPRRSDRHGDGLDFTFRNRPAEAVIARWYTGGAPGVEPADPAGR